MSLNQKFNQQSSLPRPSEETILKQPMQTHPEPTPITKSPLLPTPLAHNRQSTSPRSSASTSSRKTIFPRPSPSISRPPPLPPCNNNAMTSLSYVVSLTLFILSCSTNLYSIAWHVIYNNLAVVLSVVFCCVLCGGV